MFCEDMANYAANKALRKLGIKEEPGKPLHTFELVDGRADIDKRIPLEIGTSYMVDLNGEKFTAVGSDLGGYEGVYLGNLGGIGMPDVPDTGEPFFVGEMCEDGIWTATAIVPDISGKLTVSTLGSTSPISDKYLPANSSGGGLTVIEIETEVVDDTTTMLSEADIAKLSSAISAKMPTAIRFNLLGYENCLVFGYINFGGVEGFIANLQSREIMFMNMMGSWGAIVQGLT